MIQKFINGLSPRGKVIGVIAVITFVAFIADILFFHPLQNKIVELEEKISDEKSIIRSDALFLSHKEIILKDKETFSKYIPAKAEEDDEINRDFLRGIEELASKAKVDLIKSNPSATSKQKKYTEYFADLDCAGELKDVVSFMHSINSADDLLKIVKFNMSPKRGSASEVNVSITVSKLVMSPTVIQ